MRENRLRSAWREGRQTLDGWLVLPSPLGAELMAHQGFDSLTVDVQHGMFGVETALAMLQAISTTDVMPLCRAPAGDAAIVGKLLDAGAYGIVCPLVDTAEEAAAFVAACRYPPSGGRSFGPVRAQLYGGPDYFERADETVLTIAMIETRRGLDNLEEIVAVPGLDATYIGPGDLAIALGHAPRFDEPAAEVIEAIERIRKVTQAAGLAAGIHCGAAGMARDMLARGFQWVTVGVDAGLLGEAAGERLAAVREGRS